MSAVIHGPECFGCQRQHGVEHADDCPVAYPPVLELAAQIIAGQAFTDQDAIRVARALLDERETA